MTGEVAEYRGGCLCGAVSYVFDAPPRVTVACHCSACRKATGSAFGTWTLVAKDHFRFTSGEQQIAEFQSSDHARRLFCKRCGTTLGNFTTRRPSFIHLAAGTLDTPPTMRINLHGYTASKAPWFEITDQLPQHEDEPQPRSSA
ncbi:MAG TPA: GFA family protein [Polyangiaceae bacterium]|nr:GFA family protein [Polyangiaceae bacterium]